MSGDHNPSASSFVKSEPLDRETAPTKETESIVSEQESLSDAEDATAGVKRIEAVSQVWTATSLFLAYAGLYLMACATSLEGQTTTNLTAYAVSAFEAHSLLSTIGVVQGVLYAVIKPLMAKMADALGRFEAFSITILIFVVGYIQQAASSNFDSYASAQIFYAAGSTGLQILQQIFIADTSNLLNRALFSSFPDLPFLVTVWVGAPIAQSILDHSTWRWGYGIWAIVLPVAFMPLLMSLWWNQRKAARLGQLPPSIFKGQSVLAILKTLWFDLDFFGLLLLCAALSLILLPLTLAQSASGGWSNGSMIAMVTVGGVCLLVFVFWERSSKLAPRAFFAPALFKNRTLVAGVSIAFFYFMAFYLSVQPYFYSYLQVVQGLSVVAAGHVTQTFSFTSTVSAIVVSLLIKYTGHYKYFITFGSCVYLLGIGLMIKYRTQDTTLGALVGCQIAVGIGGGALNVPAQLGVQASVSHQNVAAATAIYLTILEVGGAVGSAISGAVWTANIPKKLAMYLPPETRDQADAIYGNLTLASTGWAQGTPTRDAINRSYQETMNILLIIAVCICAPLIPLSLMMKNYKLAEIDQHVKGRVVGGKTTEDKRIAEDNSFLRRIFKK